MAALTKVPLGSCDQSLPRNDRSLHRCIECKNVDEADELEETHVLLHKT